MRMKQLFFLVALCVVLGALPSSARAITGGQPDGNGHPYVAYLDNGVFACSGTLVSPTVLITAAHCFSDSTSAFGVNSVTGAPIVRASFDPNLMNTPAAQRVWFFGSYYFDPQFALGAGGGLPGFDTHDVAVVIFTSEGCAVPPGQRGTNSCGPIPGGVTSDQYGALPRKAWWTRCRWEHPSTSLALASRTSLTEADRAADRANPCPVTRSRGSSHRRR